MIATREVDEAIDESRQLLRGRVVWHVNSTARGGGVAELLQSLLAYARGAGVDVRWMTISGNPDFFRVTKRIHNNLHESKGDGGPLGPAEREVYEAALAEAATELVDLIHPDDIVYIHDPQPAGLVPHVVAADIKVIWRCHIGVDRPGELARGAWDFLRPLRRRRRRLRLLAGAIRLGGARQGQGLDRAAVDRRLLAEEPGPRCRRGGRHPRRGRAAGIRRRGSRALSPLRRQRGSSHQERAI